MDAPDRGVDRARGRIFTAVEELGGTPFVPFKKNTLESTEEEEPIWARMYYYFMYNRLAFMEHYHMRSNIESAFSMIKGKFGDSVRSKSDSGQVNEALCKVLCHNICVLIQAIHALNIEPIFRLETSDQDALEENAVYTS